jgi:hypothetical protein
LNLALNVPQYPVFRSFQIIGGLEIQPKPRGGMKVTRKPQGSIRRHPPALVNDLRNSRNRNVEIEGQTIHAEFERLHEFCAQNFARVDRRKSFLRLSHECSLMIVDDINIVCIALAPYKAEPPLVVDPDAVLSLSIAVQGFQTISRRSYQVS